MSIQITRVTGTCCNDYHKLITFVKSPQLMQDLKPYATEITKLFMNPSFWLDMKNLNISLDPKDTA